MKRLLMALAACGVLTLASVGIAEDGKSEKKGKRQRPTPEDIFKKMDANADGNVTLDEYKAFCEVMRAKFKEFREKCAAKKKDA